jgi:hypothetical protein
MYYLDYSSAKLSGAVIKRAGYGGVIRYIDDISNPNLVRTKHTSVAEYKDHIANGLTVYLVMEVNTGDPDGGYARGQEYARRAKRGADLLGYDGVIFFCNDTPEVSSATQWDQYLTGAASILGWERTGAYGFGNAMDIAVNQTDCVAYWQAGRKSEADKRPYLNFWQDNNTQVTVGGVTCDRNLVLKPMSDGGEDLKTDERLWLRELWELWRKGHTSVNDKHSVGEGMNYIVEMLNRSRKQEATINALVGLVSKSGGLTVEEVKAAVEDALKDAVIDVDVNVNHGENQV